MNNDLENKIENITIDLSSIDDIVEAHKKIKQELNFPDYYGENMDALNDCLSELDNINILLRINNNNFDLYEQMINVFENLDNINTVIELCFD